MRTPDDIRREVDIAADGVSPQPVSPNPSEVDTPPIFGCPDCGGPLSIIGDGVLRLRCAVGHAHTAASLLDAQAEQIEKALWVAHRTNRERAHLLRRMASESRERNQGRSALVWDDKALEYEAYVKLLHDLLKEDAFTQL